MARDFPANTANRVDLGDPTYLDPPSLSMTIGLWVKLAGTANQKLFSRWGNSKGWSFGIGSAAKLQFTKYGVADINDTSTGPGTGAWMYCAAVVTSTGVRFVRYDTSGTKTTATVASASAFLGPGASGFIGCEANPSVLAKPANGNLAEVAVWIGTELTDSQIFGAAFNGAAAAAAATPTLYMPLYGDSPEADYSGSRRSNTVYSAAVVNHPGVRPGLLAA